MRFVLPTDMSTDSPVNLGNLELVLDRLLSPDVSKFGDAHTHLPTWQMGDKIFLRGVDEMLSYHYIYRLLLAGHRDIDPDWYFSRPRQEMADIAWARLFVDSSDPIDEARLGIITTLTGWGLNPKEKDLTAFRRFFSGMDAKTHLDRILKMSGVDYYTCTNNLFDLDELPYYRKFRAKSVEWDKRAVAAMRVDTLVLTYKKVAYPFLRDEFGLTDVDEELSPTCVAAIRSWLVEWCQALPNVEYLGCSFPPEFDFMDQKSESGKVLWEIILPVARELGLPVFVMPEPIRQVNTKMKLAGDFLGLMNPASLAALAVANHDLDFWVTPLHLSSQYPMSVLTGTARNVYVWGLWWYNLHESIAKTVTPMRIEMTGTNFLPMNSDARVLDQLYYKWTHFRRWFKDILRDKYRPLIMTGCPVTVGSMMRTISDMFDEGRMRRRRKLPPVLIA